MYAWSDAQIVSLEGHGVKAFLQGYLTCNSERIGQKMPTPMQAGNVPAPVPKPQGVAGASPRAGANIENPSPKADGTIKISAIL